MTAFRDAFLPADAVQEVKRLKNTIDRMLCMQSCKCPSSIIVECPAGRFNSLLSAREQGHGAAAVGRMLPRQIPIY